jgi:hypothetical protein
MFDTFHSTSRACDERALAPPLLLVLMHRKNNAANGSLDKATVSFLRDIPNRKCARNPN